MNTAIAQGVEYYSGAKEEQDIDLISVVRSQLVSSGLANRLSTAFDSNRFIVEAAGRKSDIQRFLLNRYWNQQLMSSNKMSIEERYCLIPDGSTDEWLKLFQDKVLPFIIENGLPIEI